MREQRYSRGIYEASAGSPASKTNEAFHEARVTPRILLVFLASQQAVGVHSCRTPRCGRKRYYKNIKIGRNEYGFHR
jgi:hypothetical protein